MNRMETVPNELNLVKKVADFRLIRGKTITTKKRGTFQYNDYYQIQGQNDCISGLIMTELNPNYEFAGGSCSIQDLMEVDRDNLMLVK